MATASGIIFLYDNKDEIVEQRSYYTNATRKKYYEKYCHMVQEGWYVQMRPFLSGTGDTAVPNAKKYKIPPEKMKRPKAEYSNSKSLYDINYDNEK